MGFWQSTTGKSKMTPEAELSSGQMQVHIYLSLRYNFYIPKTPQIKFIESLVNSFKRPRSLPKFSNFTIGMHKTLAGGLFPGQSDKIGLQIQETILFPS